MNQLNSFKAIELNSRKTVNDDDGKEQDVEARVTRAFKNYIMDSIKNYKNLLEFRIEKPEQNLSLTLTLEDYCVG